MYEQIALAGLDVIGKVMDKTPDYDDRKREEYKKLRTDFEKEIQKPYGIRNDRRMLDMGDELLRHVETFSAFIPTSSLASLRGTGREKA